MDKMYLFFLLCICHGIGDFFLQTEETAREKKTKKRIYLRHAVWYAVPYAAGVPAAWAAGSSADIIGLFLWCVLSHAAIDFVKIRLDRLPEERKKRVFGKNAEAGIYLGDQAVHILCLICGSIFYQGTLPGMPEYMNKAIPYVLYFLYLLKPANITFKQLFSRFHVDAGAHTGADIHPEAEKQMKTQPAQVKEGAGAWIGNLERLLSGIFILLGQFSAVGLTMTAKSVARYDQISKNPAFAEYYLIGTLYSILYTVILYCLIFRFLL